MATILSSLASGVGSGINGSGKRASYALISANSSTTWYGYALLDENFLLPIQESYSCNSNTQTYSNVVNLSSSYHIEPGASMSLGFVRTQSNTGSSSGSFISGTNSCGQFGNAATDIFSDGTFNKSSRSSSWWPTKLALNSIAIDSNHSNKRIVYCLYSGKIMAIDLLYGNRDYPSYGSTYSVSSLDTSMHGSASYHLARKELTIISYSASGGSYNVYTFSNVDFDTYPDPSIALARPEVTRVNSTVTLPNWQVNSAESYYGLKVVVTDNGKVYVSVMFESSSFYLYDFTRSGTAAITATARASLSNTTSYGEAQGWPNYGQRRITSRDGTTAVCFTPYYYYCSGISAYMIDKTGNTYTTYQYSDTSFGHQVIPWKDNGWAFYYAGNYYAANYSGAYIAATYDKVSSGGFTQRASNIYLPIAPGPNTTNYPGITQVTDYNLLFSNTLTSYGAK